MTLYYFLLRLKTNAKIIITDEDETFTIYADSVNALDELILYKMVKEWSLAGNQTIKVVLETIVSG